MTRQKYFDFGRLLMTIARGASSRADGSAIQALKREFFRLYEAIGGTSDAMVETVHDGVVIALKMHQMYV